MTSGVKDVNLYIPVDDDRLLQGLRYHHGERQFDGTLGGLMEALLPSARGMTGATPMHAGHPRADKRGRKLGRDE